MQNKDVIVSVKQEKPVVTVSFQTDDMDQIRSLAHRLNVGRHRLYHARKRVRNPHTDMFEGIGPAYGQEYDLTSPQDLKASETPLAELCDMLFDVLDDFA